MQLERVNLEQAKKLKELGYPQTCYDGCYLTKSYEDEMYDFDVGDIVYFTTRIDNAWPEEYDRIPKDILVEAPHMELVSKWLREEKNLWIHMCKPNQRPRMWSSSVNSLDGKLWEPCPEFDTYEESLSAGIDKAIKILNQNKT